MRRLIILILSITITLHSHPQDVTTAVCQPVYDLLNRIEAGASSRFLLQQTGDSTDYFELDQLGDQVVIRGNNCVSIASGINWYLKYYCNIHLSWNNMTATLPRRLPKVRHTERHTASLPLRYYLNYCTFSYSMAYWDWDRWEKEIDWMALHGINLPLAAVGNECVWRNVLRRRGYTQDQIDRFIPGPSFLAWWEMNNLEGWGGPLSDNWYTQQERLQKQILSRMREFGMSPVLPGYCGMVPHQECNSAPQHWCGFTRPGILSTNDTLFHEFATLYYEEQERLFGKTRYYSTDPFHESGDLPEGFDIRQSGRDILKYMKRFAGDSVVWVLQSWGENPRPELLSGLNPKNVLVLDLFGENHTPQAYGPHHWCLCMLLNFGGNVGLHGRIDALLTNYSLALQQPPATLQGIGLTMEGIENNPVMYELMTELPWRPSPVDKETWIKDYVQMRYGGKTNKHINKAWAILINTIYNCPINAQQGTTESVFCAKPSWSFKQVSAWSNVEDYYPTQSTVTAANEMKKAFHQFRSNDNFIYDYIDITRQANADSAREVYYQMASAHNEGRKKECAEYVNTFLSLLLAQDSLLSSHKDFSLSTYLNMAHRKGVTPAEQALYEKNLLLQITTWAEEGSPLNDYAHKEWSGLLRNYYYPRWRAFLSPIINSEEE